MTPEEAAKLRAPLDPEDVDQLPKPTRKDAQKGRCNDCGGWHGLPAVHLDYAGHAAVTDRLLAVDPGWTWEPVANPVEQGLLTPPGGMWIRLTVCGVTRYGYGDADGKTGGNAVKEVIGDALRNAAMRFGVGLDLWRKEAKARRQHELDESAHGPTDDRPEQQVEADGIREEIKRFATSLGWDLRKVAAGFDREFNWPIQQGSPKQLEDYLGMLRVEAQVEADKAAAS